MRVSARRILTRNTQACVAVHAEELAVTNDARSGIGRGLLVVHRHEVGSVHRIPHRGVEIEPRGNRRHGDAVAFGALALGVAGRAQITLRAGLQAVLAQEVTSVNDVAVRARHLAWQVHMTSTAIPRVPLAFVRVAAEAGGMLDADVVRVGGDVHVTSDAVSGALFDVRRMRET